MAIYLLIAALAFLALFFAVKKVALNADEKAFLEPIRAEIYPAFCDFIDEKIKELKERVKSGEITLKDAELKDEFLEKLSDCLRELTFIQTMNLSKKNDELWQSELFEFLSNLEKLIVDFASDGEGLSESLRAELMNEFERLKNQGSKELVVR